MIARCLSSSALSVASGKLCVALWRNVKNGRRDERARRARTRPRAHTKPHAKKIAGNGEPKQDRDAPLVVKALLLGPLGDAHFDGALAIVLENLGVGRSLHIDVVDEILSAHLLKRRRRRVSQVTQIALHVAVCARTARSLQTDAVKRQQARRKARQSKHEPGRRTTPLNNDDERAGPKTSDHSPIVRHQAMFVCLFPDGKNVFQFCGRPALISSSMPHSS